MASIIEAFRAITIPPDPITAVGIYLIIVVGIGALFFKLIAMIYDRRGRR